MCVFGFGNHGVRTILYTLCITIVTTGQLQRDFPMFEKNKTTKRSRECFGLFRILCVWFLGERPLFGSLRFLWICDHGPISRCINESVKVRLSFTTTVSQKTDPRDPTTVAICLVWTVCETCTLAQCRLHRYPLHVGLHMVAERHVYSI